MKCPEVAPLVSRFFDGELDGCHMRTVALHITRCRECEDELRTLERIQDLVSQEIASEVELIDLDLIWHSVSAQIDDASPSLPQRFQAWWDEFEFLSPMTVWPAAMAAAAVFFAVNFWPADVVNVGVEVAREARVEIADIVADVGRRESLFREAMEQIDNSAVFESIVGGVDRFMVEPKTQTAVLWIDDTGEFR